MGRYFVLCSLLYGRPPQCNWRTPVDYSSGRGYDSGRMWLIIRGGIVFPLLQPELQRQKVALARLASESNKGQKRSIRSALFFYKIYW